MLLLVLFAVNSFLPFDAVTGKFFGFSDAPTAQAAAGVNSSINFQARLLNSAGATVPDGLYNMQFKIYHDGTGCVSSGSSPCGGTLDWTESWLNNATNGVTVRNGYFSVYLGSITSFGGAVDFNQDTLWLSINVGSTNGSCTPFTGCSGDGEMLPFKRLAANAYSNNSAQLGGLDKTQFVQLGQGLQADTSNSNASIAINKTGSANILDLQKAGSTVALLSNTGALTLTNTANSSAAFQVQNSSGQAIFNVDTTNAKIGTPNSTVATTRDLKIATGDASSGTNLSSGNLTIDTGTKTGSGTAGSISIGGVNAPQITFKVVSGANSTTVNFTTPTATNSINFPDAGGTVCTTISTTCGSVYGSAGSFVTLQASTPGTAQTGSSNITGTAIVGTNLITPLAQTTDQTAASTNSASLAIRSGNASGATSNSGNLTIDAGTATTTAGTITVGGTNASAVTLGRAGAPLTLQGNANTKLTATNAGVTTTVDFSTPTANVINRFAASSAGTYTVCTSDSTTCGSTYGSAGTYLAKNAADTSSAAVTASNFLYNFTNSSSAVASGVLKVDNGSNTNSAFSVTQSGNPTSGQALIYANNSNGTPSGNLLDLAAGGTSKFSVSAAGNVVSAGTINTNTFTGSALTFGAASTASIASASSQALNITGNAASTLSTSSGDLTVQGGSGVVSLGSSTTLKAGGVLTIQSGGAGAVAIQSNAQTTGSTNSAAVSISSGNASGATSNSGGVNIDSGTATGTAGTVNVGTANAGAVSVGRSGQVTTINGTGTIAGNANLNGTANTIGDATTDRLTVTAQISGGTPFVFQGTTDNAITTTFAITDPTTSSKTITFGDETGTVCTTAASAACTAVYSVAGAYLQQIPASTAVNTITPSAANTVGLTVNGTSNGTSATAVIVNQSGASDGVAINLTNAAGTQTNGTLINRNTAGGTTTNLLNLTNTAGAATNALTFSGTFTKLINSTNFNVTNAGAVTAVGVDAGSGLIQGTGGITAVGTAQINNSGAGTTTIGVGSSGTIGIGNGSSGVITLQSGAAINITAGAASTISTGANTLAVTSSNYNLSTAGVITLAGNQTADITTAAAGAANPIAIQPGNSTTNSGTGSTLNLKAGNNSGTTSTGGTANLDAGTGTTTNGAVNVGTTNANSVSVGRSGKTTTINGDAAITGTSNLNGNTNLNGTTNTIGDATTDRLGLTAQISGGTPFVFQGATDNAVTTSFVITDPTSSSKTITFGDETGTVCTTAASAACTAVYSVAGNYLQQIPASTAVNTITPSAASTVGLTVNGTSNGTSATAVIVNQSGASDGVAINLTNASGTQTNGTLINRNTAGGTTTNLLNLTNTAGTATNALTFSGTFTKLINSTNFNVTNAGAVTAVGVDAGSGLIQGTGGITAVGTAQINNSGSGTTTIGVGSSGTVGIGNGSTGAITLQSGAAINITAGAASTISTGANTLAVTSSNYNLSTAGVITLAGNQTADITTATSGSANPIAVQPGVSTTNSGTGSALNLKAGNNSGTTSTGGSASLDAGTGTTTNGAVNVGTTNANSVSIGRSGKTSTINGDATVTGTTNLNGVANLNGNTTIGDATTDRLTVTAQILGGSPLVFQGATDNAVTTTLAFTDPATTSKTITFGDETGTVCTTAASAACTAVYSVAGAYLQQIPASTAVNTITPAAASTVGLTVNGTSNATSATALIVNQVGASNGENINLTNTSGTQTAGLAIARSVAGGTTTDGINITQSNGTLSNGLTISGTVGNAINLSGSSFTKLINSTNFNVTNAGALSAVGIDSGTGLLQGTGGQTITGTTQINASGAGTTTIGNGSAGAISLTSGSTLVLSGTNIAVSSAGVITLAGNQTADITTTAAGAANPIAIQPGNSTTNSGTGSTLNLKAGNNSGTTSTGGSANLDAGTGTTTNGSVNIGTSNANSVSVGRSGKTTTINGDAAITGTTNHNGNTNLNGTANTIGDATTDRLTVTAQISGGTPFVFQGATDNAITTSFVITDPTTSSKTITFGDETGTVCTTAASAACTAVYAVAGNYLQQIPASTAVNTITPSAASTVGLTVNGTSNGTSATAVIVNQSGASDGVAINLTNGSGTQTNGTLINRNTAGGTTTNLLNLTNTAGTATNALTFSGTFTKLINSTNFNVTNAGAVTAVGIDAGSGLIQGTGGITAVGTAQINNSGSGTTTIGVGSSGTIGIGNGSSGVVTLQSGSAVNITAGAASTISTGANTLAVTSSNYNLSTAGVITLAGNQTADITTTAAGAANPIAIQPGNSTTNSGTGSTLNLKAGNNSGTTSTGGSTNIDAGTGTTTNGAVNVGTTNANSVSIGRTGKTSTINGDAAVTGTINLNGNANLNGNTTIGDATTDRLTVTAQISGGTPFVFQGATDNAITTSFVITDPTSSSKTITFGDETGTVCTTAASAACTAVYAVAGNYLQQIPASTAVNTITPSAANTVGLTVNGTSNGTSATAVIVNQVGASDGIAVNLTNAAGTQTNGLLLNRNTAGGTTTNLLNLTNTAGTATNGLTFSGTFTKLINSTNFNVTNAGAVTAVGVDAGSGLIQGTGGITAVGTAQINNSGSGTTTIGVGSSGTIGIGNGSTGAITLQSGAAVNITAGAASTISTGANTLAVTSSNYNLSTAGVITLAGNQTADITTTAAGAANPIAVKPGNSTTNSGTGATLNLKAGNNSGTTSSGGSVNVDAGTGTTTNGTVNVGTTDANSVSIGRNGKNTTVNGNLVTGTSAGSGTTFTNNGSTTNSTLALGNLSAGSIGTAGTTVDVYTSFSISPTASGRTYTIPAPASGAGAIIYISNINATNSFIIGGTTFNAHSTATLVYDGTSWNFAGMDGGSSNYIQNQSAADQAASFRVSGTGAINSTSATALQVQSASGTDTSLTVDTSANKVKIGNDTGTNTNTTLLVLDNATSAPATAVNGSMFYNTTTNHISCYENGAWGDCGSSTLQTTYTLSTGGTTPEILADATRGAVDIQDANTTLGANVGLLSVRGAASSSTLGASLFVVNAGGKVGIANGGTTNTNALSYDLSFGQGANRTIGVEVQGTAATAGNNLTLSAGTGNTSGIGGTFAIQAGTGGNAAAGGQVTITGGTAGGGNSAGGAVALQGGTSTGTGTGGTASLLGGAASATSGSAGGGVAITGANGTSTSTGGAGGSVAITAGSGTSSGANNGGSVNITPGTATGAGTPGLVNVGATSFTASATESNGSNFTLAQAKVDTNSTIPVNPTTTGITVTVPNPTNTTNGRVLYLTNVNASNYFTVLGAQISSNTSATLVWNSVNSVWTFAGADASSILNQSAADQAASFRLSGTGAINGTSATAFTVKNTSSADTTLTVDTSANKVKLGNDTGTNTNTTLLVLDNATAAPATAVNGSMFYNTTTGHVQCYEGGAWGDCGSSTLQTTYNLSTGGTTPEILADATRGAVDIQDANTTLGANVGLLSVRGAASATTLGASLFVVNAGGKVGIANGGTTNTNTLAYDLSFGQGANRTIGVELQATSNTAGNNLTLSAGTGANGGTSGVGGTLAVQGGTGGSTAAGGQVMITGGTGGGGNTAGGAVTLQGGTSAGTATGGTATVAGGAASATSGSAGGAVAITGANGTSTSTGGAGGSVTITAGSGTSSGANNGGNISLTAGTATGAGTPGLVNIGATSFTASATESNGSNFTLAQAKVDANSTIPVNPTTTGITVTVPNPTNTTNGRVLYLTNVNASNYFTVLGAQIGSNTSATLVWNSVNSVWTFAGADASSILNQSAADQAASFRLSGTGAINGTSATAFTVKNTSSADTTLTVDTSANKVKIGNDTGTNTATTLLVLDNATSAPATAVNGSMFYNTTSGHVQCYEGGAWGDCGSSTLQTTYNLSTGGATPEILADSTRGAVDIQDANTTLGANVGLLSVRGAASASTLGASLFVVNAGGKVGIANGGTTNTNTLNYDLSFGQIAGASTARTIGVELQTTATTQGNGLTLSAGTGATTGTGGTLALQGGAGGSTSGIGGVVTITGGTGGGSNVAGGAVTLQGGTAAGTGTGGQASVTGGSASATAGSASGAVAISTTTGAAGSGATNAGAAGNITLQGGTGGAGTGTNSLGAAGASISLTAGSGGVSTGSAANSNGGSISFSAGSAGTGGSGTAGVPGVVNIATPVFTSVSETFTQTSNNQAFNSTTDPAILTNLNSSGTIVMNVTGAFTGATITMPSPTNTAAGRVVFVSAASGSVAFTLAATGMSSVNMSAGNTATLVWNGTGWSGTTTASSLQQVYNNTSTTPASIITTSSTKNILFQAGVGFDNANLFQVGNSLGAQALTVDTSNTASSTNLGQNTGGETAGPTGWSAYVGSITPTVAQTTTTGEFASGAGAVRVTFGSAGTGGVNNALNSAALATAATVYNVSFSMKAGTSAPSNANLVVEYYRDASTLDATCATAPSPAITTTAFGKFNCTFTSSSTAKTTANFLRIRQTDSVQRIWYIDNFALIAQTTGTQNVGAVQVGGVYSQGLTVLTLDSYAAQPFTGTTNTALLGSMYYDTTTGRIQCYESDGWGSCGAAPNNSVALVPEYGNSVLNGSGSNNNGTMTANLCANVGTLAIQTSLCAASDSYSYYKWTSTQATAQTFDIYVKYQLPPTFRDFTDNNTIKLAARTSNTTNGIVTYSVFKESTGAQCGSDTVVNSSANAWQTTSLTGNEQSCGFVAGDFMIFKINMSAKSSDAVYASNITLTMTGK